MSIVVCHFLAKQQVCGMRPAATLPPQRSLRGVHTFPILFPNSPAFPTIHYLSPVFISCPSIFSSLTQAHLSCSRLHTELQTLPQPSLDSSNIPQLPSYHPALSSFLNFSLAFVSYINLISSLRNLPNLVFSSRFSNLHHPGCILFPDFSSPFPILFLLSHNLTASHFPLTQVSFSLPFLILILPSLSSSIHCYTSSS